MRRTIIVMKSTAATATTTYSQMDGELEATGAVVEEGSVAVGALVVGAVWGVEGLV